MRQIKLFIIFLVFAVSVCSILPVKAQCSLCSSNVETNLNNGGTQADGLNHGIMYLLAAPYIAIAAVGFIWYKNYRRKNVNLKMRDERLNLN